jgi:drug/metabolite transporter (DMT)-like permease
MVNVAMPAPRRQVTSGHALVVLLALTWGGYWPAMKIALGEVDVWLFRTLSGIGGGLTFLALLKASGARLTVARQEWRPLIVTTLLNMTLFPLCSLLALRLYGAGPAVIIAYTMPVWVALLASTTLKEALTLRLMGALGLGFLGIGALASEALLSMDGAPVAGPLLVLVGAIVWAVGVALQKLTRWTTPVPVLTGWQLLLGTTPFVPMCVIASDFSVLAKLSLAAALGWAYSTFVGFVLGYLLFYQIIARLPVTVAAMTSLAVPVAGVLASALVLGEHVSAAEMIALGLVVSAVGLVLFDGPRDRSS